MKPFSRTSAYPMIPLAQAWAEVDARLAPLSPVEVPIEVSLGCVLAEDLVADANVPSVPTSRMDGYAVIAADTTQWRTVLGEEDAGQRVDTEVRPGTALRIMTGAPLPPGADAVIQVEDTSEEDGRVHLHRSVAVGENLRRVGVDLAVGDLVIPAGTPIGPPEIGLMATLGRANALVRPRPRVAVLATGDELLQPGEPLPVGPGAGAKIYDSNSFTLAAAVRQAGGIPRRGLGRFVVLDNEDDLGAALLEAREQADMIVTSGGVSMGTRDLLKPVLSSMGEVFFGRVAIKPGKPLTFGAVGNVPLFGLPGFPVSSLVTFELVVRPALRILAGHAALFRPTIEVRLAHPVRQDLDRTEFQRANIERRDGAYWATTTGAQLSSRLTSLRGADALLRIPHASDTGSQELPEGTRLKALLINQPEILEGESPS